MRIDYNELLDNLSYLKRQEIIKEIYNFIIYDVPDWDIVGNNPNLLHQRIKFPLNILKELLYCEMIERSREYGTKQDYSNTFLRKLDLSEFDLSDIDVTYWNLSYTNVNLNPQKVENKSLYKTNCRGLNLSGKDFTDVDVCGANLEDTMANIDPQGVRNKDLSNTNCKGLNFEGKDFTGVNVSSANLEGTCADICLYSEPMNIESHIKRLILQKVNRR